MLGYSEYHHDLLYKYVTLFGSLFTGLQVFRQGSTEDELVKVPLNFASVQKVLAFAEKQHRSNQMAIATLVPRMSFDIESIVYDPQRKTNKFNTRNTQTGPIRDPQPYNIMFSLNVMTKTERDATRIVEQIIPHFDPAVSLTMFPFNSDPTNSHDIKISLVSVSRNNDYQGAAENRQTIIWSMIFELQGYLYGPKQTGKKIIKKIKINYDSIGSTDIYPGSTTEGEATTDPLATIDYTLIDEEDNWDFIVEHKDE